MALSTLLMVLGIAVLLRGVALPSWVGWGLVVGGVGLAVRAQGLAVGLTCAAVLGMLVAPGLALALPLWPRATRYGLPVGAVGLAWLWWGGA
ncbi:hypothetical protein LZ198_37050 [Myxococcus sp. K15C18031901]|uniref:hypothetical protein n=1 Tax=Myxococcus dinghuensis TaxID=2906761 RepID=UPI0020A73854|nr:hypothetical protein [Myxococcus dinghuensis]MCP3104486.1 hypothetical protein [Myxococcus dinghuensis]